MNYFDKNGNQIKAGMDIRMADGSFERVYTELHSLKDCSHVVPDIIASTLKSIVKESDNRQGRLLFKLAVEVAILQNVIAANYDIDQLDLDRLRGICVNEVKKINGSISFDEAIRWQS